MKKTFLTKPMKIAYIRTYDNIREITTEQGDEYTTGCLLDYPYFKEYYKMIAIDLSKQEALDSDPKAIQQTNFPIKMEIQQCFPLLKKRKKNFFFFHKDL